MTKKQATLFAEWNMDLETVCDKLHFFIEIDLEYYLNPERTDRTPFYNYRTKLVNQYKLA